MVNDERNVNLDVLLSVLPMNFLHWFYSLLLETLSQSMEKNTYAANPWDADEERRYGNTRRLMALACDMGYKVGYLTRENSMFDEKLCNT